MGGRIVQKTNATSSRTENNDEQRTTTRKDTTMPDYHLQDTTTRSMFDSGNPPTGFTHDQWIVLRDRLKSLDDPGHPTAIRDRVHDQNADIHLKDYLCHALKCGHNMNVIQHYYDELLCVLGAKSRGVLERSVIVIQQVQGIPEAVYPNGHKLAGKRAMLAQQIWTLQAFLNTQGRNDVFQAMRSLSAKCDQSCHEGVLRELTPTDKPPMANAVYKIAKFMLDLLEARNVFPVSDVLKGGDGFIQLGEWRVGNVDGTHFSFSHKSGHTAMIFRKDGTVHSGPGISVGDAVTWAKSNKNIPEGAIGVVTKLNLDTNKACVEFPSKNALVKLSDLRFSGIDPIERKDYGLWDKDGGEAKNVKIGQGFLEFSGVWRLGEVNAAHMSISHRDGKTAMIWRNDGTRHPGPRDDYSTWEKPLVAAHVSWGDRFIQLGAAWRFGDVDGTHFSIGEASKQKTAVIYKSDGTVHSGPCSNYGLWGRDIK